MESSFPARLVGSDIHGFFTMEDLDVPSIMREAHSRWLRPNEIHAMLSNYAHFIINVKPVTLPKGGTIVLFDRKKLRNFRKDGHNWKKKKDGKTVKEAHERLKVGTEERIHVYYAHGEDNPTFVRRCYWLLDKDLEHIVLVHYRETQEGSPVKPVNYNISPDSKAKSTMQECIGAGDIIDLDHDMRLHEINTLEWDELLASNGPDGSTLPENSHYMQQYNEHAGYSLENNGSSLYPSNLQSDMITSRNSMDPLLGIQMYTKAGNGSYDLGTTGPGDPDNMVQGQDSLARWINDIVADSPESVEASVVTSHGSYMSHGTAKQEGSVLNPIFSVTDISPQWALLTEETKILVVGFFHQEYQHLGNSKIFCVFGDTCVLAEVVQVGVLRCLVHPHHTGLVNFYLSFDRCTPISQILTFEFRSPTVAKSYVRDNHPEWDKFRIQTRLAHLLFSTSKSLEIVSSKVPPHALKEGKKFAVKYSNIADSWEYFTSLVENGKISFGRAKDSLFELALKSRLKEWLLERIIDGSKLSERDAHGQGVLHLCAILGYTWAVYPFSCSGLSLDFRDKFGWTALHWAAYYGREKMVAALLSAGAKPNLVTDPTPQNPGGCTVADLASKQGFEGIAAYLSEKALIRQFEDMKIAGNVKGSLSTPTQEAVNTSNDGVSNEEICLKDTLTAYRTAADAAARIQAALREHSLKQRTQAVESSNPEAEARCIVAAMRIQHAYKNYETRKKMKAAVRIQHRFRTWKVRREFLDMRQRAIKIQAVFRGYLVRRQYKKIIWSVGVLEKVVLRWRMKRKGLRGLQIQIKEPVVDQTQEVDGEEDFYRASREQAEERVDKAVRRIQAIFRSRQAQQDYRSMKLMHRQAELEYEEYDECIKSNIGHTP